MFDKLSRKSCDSGCGGILDTKKGSNATRLVGLRQRLRGNRSKQRPYSEFEVIHNPMPNRHFAYVSSTLRNNSNIGAARSSTPFLESSLAVEADRAAPLASTSSIHARGGHIAWTAAHSNQYSASATDVNFGYRSASSSDGIHTPERKTDHDNTELIGEGLYSELARAISSFLFTDESNSRWPASLLDCLDQLGPKSTAGYCLDDIAMAMRDRNALDHSTALVVVQHMVRSALDSAKMEDVLDQVHLKSLLAQNQALHESINSSCEGRRHQQTLLDGFNKLMRLHDQNKEAYQAAMNRVHDAEKRIHVFQKNIYRARIEQSRVAHRLMHHCIGLLSATIRSHAGLLNDIETRHSAAQKTLQDEIGELGAQLGACRAEIARQEEEHEQKEKDRQLVIEYWKSQAEMSASEAKAVKDQLESQIHEVARLNRRLAASLENEKKLREHLAERQQTSAETSSQRQRRWFQSEVKIGEDRRHTEERAYESLDSACIDDNTIAAIRDSLRKIAPSLQEILQAQLEGIALGANKDPYGNANDHQEPLDTRISILNSLAGAPGAGSFDLKDLPNLFALVDKGFQSCIRSRRDIIQARHDNSKLASALDQERQVRRAREDTISEKDKAIKALSMDVSRLRVANAKMSMFLPGWDINRGLGAEKPQVHVNAEPQDPASTGSSGQEAFVPTSILKPTATLQERLIGHISHLEMQLAAKDRDLEHAHSHLVDVRIVLQVIVDAMRNVPDMYTPSYDMAHSPRSGRECDAELLLATPSVARVAPPTLCHLCRCSQHQGTDTTPNLTRKSNFTIGPGHNQLTPPVSSNSSHTPPTSPAPSRPQSPGAAAVPTGSSNCHSLATPASALPPTDMDGGSIAKIAMLTQQLQAEFAKMLSQHCHYQLAITDLRTRFQLSNSTINQLKLAIKQEQRQHQSTRHELQRILLDLKRASTEVLGRDKSLATEHELARPSSRMQSTGRDDGQQGRCVAEQAQGSQWNSSLPQFPMNCVVDAYEFGPRDDDDDDDDDDNGDDNDDDDDDEVLTSLIKAPFTRQRSGSVVSLVNEGESGRSKMLAAKVSEYGNAFDML